MAIVGMHSVRRATDADAVEIGRPCAHGVRRVYWQTHQTDASGRALYDQVAKHDGFIVYAHDL